jgi:hypothetical protein
MVRSAYNPVVDLEWNMTGQAGRSSRTDGSRMIFGQAQYHKRFIYLCGGLPRRFYQPR